VVARLSAALALEATNLCTGGEQKNAPHLHTHTIQAAHNGNSLKTNHIKDTATAADTDSIATDDNSTAATVGTLS
jgi:hypothetical protein